MKRYYLPCYSKYTNYWQYLCFTYGGLILDRTNTLKFGDFEYSTLTAIPEFSIFTNSFEEVCDARAHQLVKKADDTSINIMWSGGIDSTTAVVAFLRNNLHKHIHLLLNNKSINEYPWFYENVILKENISHSLVEKPKDHLHYSKVNVTGEIGDQIFGSAAFFDAHHKGKLFSKPEEYYDPEFLEIMSEQIKHSPYELKETKDYMWWVNFSLKYQNVQLRIYPTIFMPYGGIDHFFDTDDFQLWSMNNPDKKIRDTLESYKWPAKDYIFDYTKDEQYRQTKLKVGSLRIGAMKAAIDTDFRFEPCDCK
jgi:hypothetical protein